MKKTLALICAVLFAGAVHGQTIYDNNPISTISQNPGFCSIFHYWGFIGDSLCSGEFEFDKPDGTTGFWECYEYSWGMRMCKLMGVEGEVYAQGGETAKGWIKNFWDSDHNKRGVCAKGDPKQVYVIGLGVNDSNPTYIADNYPVGKFPDDINFEDYTKNALTFTGCYAGIIQRLQEMQPEVKIFIVSIPRRGDRYTEYNKTIKEMAGAFSNIWLIDLEKYAADFYHNDVFTKLYMPNGHGHLTPAGYEYSAWVIMTYIDWIIRNDMDAFKEIGFMLPGAPERKK